MILVEISESPAVGYEVTLEAPLAAEKLSHQVGVGTAGFAVGTVICTHYGLDLTLDDRSLKLGKVSLVHILHACLGIK